ncbi:MAG: peptide-methionine (S)-S-oxide reductase MsrA [Flavobacteriales bacterium]|nr:peptide-methionine (S)-S-oxide reductase MsrA [Flavobacteriales bacterium]
MFDPARPENPTATAVFGTGCFWCSEAVFTALKGVQKVTPGYMGGSKLDPTYKEVCSGSTGHAEVSRIVFDPAVITFDELLHVFWKTHDPTSLNRQGGDVGTQYRSVIFCTDADQQAKAEEQRKHLDQSGAWDRPIVTEIVPVSYFYAAENYHHDYFANNPDQGYCQMVIRPKLEKFRSAFKDKLK